MRRVHVIVTGTVQGVGYRWSTRLRAEGLGLGGWVRNRGDGAVEAELEGPEDAVEQLLDWMADGPPGARVRDFRTAELDPTGAKHFEVRA
ncbi:acylphosphatase [Tessaracoccus rhinocerotis]|uniref:acylphosphatase n=1 Tax=Tessaracoccus rhinocerotis TaxID=1689449 RepID=A0A553K2F8_9ACTN|nr:acylphosphatase [Tessaracoccus rhinocerotis]TRY18876.1 acylphosphatase [Tessaracoccus rhinocerotis]